MKGFLSLIRALITNKKHTILSVLFQLLTAVFTVVSIPFIIPFFQLLFDSKTVVNKPDGLLDIDGHLTFFFASILEQYDRQYALLVVCAILIVLFFFRNLFRYLGSYYLIPARNAVLRDLRSRLYEGYQSMSLTDRKRMKKGQLLSMMSNDIVEIDHAMLKAVELIFKVPLIVFGSLILMLLIDVQLTLVALVLVLVTLLVVGRLSHYLKKTSTEAQYILGEMNAASEEYLDAAKMIKTYNADGFFRKNFVSKNEAHYALSNRMLRRRDLASPLSEFLAVVIICCLLWFGAHQVFDNELNPASFFAFIFAFYSIIDPAKSFSREYYNVQKGEAAWDRINGFIQRTKASNCTPIEGVDSISFADSIEVSGLSFRYDDADVDLFSDLSFSIKKGEKIGIVGASGAGKSTLFDLLLGFYKPNNGDILLDGVSIGQYSTSSYRQLWGIVTQEPHIFNMTPTANIALSENPVHDMVFSALGLDFLKNRETLADSGMTISGGQRQRVALARVLHHDPEIVILDEPTSALDAESEETLLSEIFTVLSDRTIIMSSHDSRLLSRLDRIIVIEDGEIAREGTYEEIYGDAPSADFSNIASS